MTTMTTIPDIRITRLAFYLIAESTIRLPRFPGSVFRGGFGMALRRACCTTKKKDCQDCMLNTSCVYASVFETASAHASGGKYQLKDYPRPFIIEPPYPVEGLIEPGESFVCHLVLMGPVVEQLPYFVYAFSRLGQSGLGKGRGKFRIDGVMGAIGDEDAAVFDGLADRFVGPPPTVGFGDLFEQSEALDRIALSFVTPTRIKQDNHLTKKLDFDLLMRNLFRRISILVELCTGNGWDVDYQGLLQKAKEVRCSDSTLYWFDFKRYSGKQKNEMRLGGFLGSAVFEGELSAFLPFLRLGEYLHVGKACTFGLGKFEIGDGGF